MAAYMPISISARGIIPKKPFFRLARRIHIHQTEYAQAAITACKPRGNPLSLFCAVFFFSFCHETSIIGLLHLQSYRNYEKQPDSYCKTNPSLSIDLTIFKFSISLRFSTAFTWHLLLPFAAETERADYPASASSPFQRSGAIRATANLRRICIRYRVGIVLCQIANELQLEAW